MHGAPVRRAGVLNGALPGAALSSMRRCVGILAEKYSKWERRAALTPLHVDLGGTQKATLP